MGAFASVDNASKRFEGAIAKMTRQLQELSQANAGGHLKRDIEAAAKSGIFIWLAGALEVFLNEVFDAVLLEVEITRTPAVQIQYRLFSIACAGELQSLQDLRGLKMWRRRADLVESMGASGPIAFHNRLLPLDGSTPRKEHFETIWKVFGLPGAPLPSARHGLALYDLAETRNRLAHGDDDPVTVGRSKALPDVEALTVRIEEIGSHVYLAAEQFLTEKRYQR